MDLGASLRKELGLLTEEEVAAIGDLDPKTLARWRTARTGPPAVTVGRTILYRRESLEAWLKAQERSYSAEPHPRP